VKALMREFALQELYKERGDLLLLHKKNSKCMGVSGCHNLLAAQTPGPISVKFGRNAQLNDVFKIAIVLYPYPCLLGQMFG